MPPTWQPPPAFPLSTAVGGGVDAGSQGNAPGISVVCSPPPNTTFPIGTTTVTCTASDPFGHSSSATFTVTVQDTLAPLITQVPAAITVEATGPGGATATYSAPTAVDQVDGAVTPGCTPASGSTFPIGKTTVTCTATDAHRNASSASFPVNVVDTTPPTLTLPGTITVTATGANGAAVSYSASASDLVDGAVTPACAPASGSTFPLGTTPVTCTATDAHGNTATGSFLVQVGYSWSGVLPPINADGSSIFRLGRTVPVKFQLTGASAGITNAVATLTVAQVSGTVTGTVVEAASTSAATPGNTFRYDSSSGQYIFNMATNSLSTGTWRLAIDLQDGVSRTVSISLR
jgi:hypothetical protein